MRDDSPRNDEEVSDDSPRGDGGSPPRSDRGAGEERDAPERYPENDVTGGGDPHAEAEEEEELTGTVGRGESAQEPARNSRPDESADGEVPAASGSRSRGQDRTTTVIVRTVTRLAVPIILVTSVALLLQGHNLPGGGFIGGVLTVTAFVLVYVIFGLDYIERGVLDRSADGSGQAGMVGVYRWLFSLGLAIAAGAGIVPVLFDAPFLSQGVLFIEHPLGPVPLYEEFEVASALAFDLGVYFVVVGGLLTVVGVVGRE